MSAMKDTGIEWIGEIPLGWELRRIKTNFKILAGATPKSGEARFWDGDIPWITPADYTTEGVYVSAGHKSITQDGLNSCATSLIPEGSIIFSKRAPVGLVAINSNPLCTNQGCLSCIPKDSVDAKYYYYVMSIYGEQFDLFASGTTFKEISADAFANFKLPYPDYETQKRITSFLDAKCTEIDALIAAKEKTNALLKERRQSIIYEAVTKGLDPTAPMKDSGVEWIGEMPNGWELRKIKTSFSIVAGATPKSDVADYWDGAIPWITPADYTTEDVFVLAGRKSITQEGLDSCATTIIPSGSIIFSKRAPVGLVAINRNSLCTNQGCLSCVPRDEVDVKYHYYAMSIFCEQFDQLASGTTFKEISTEAFANFKLPHPDYHTQQRIAANLDKKCAEINALIDANISTIHKLKEYRQSLIYESVTGKIEV